MAWSAIFLVLASVVGISRAQPYAKYKCYVGNDPISEGFFNRGDRGFFSTTDDRMGISLNDCGTLRYQNNVRCSWDFEVPEGRYVGVVFASFKLDRSCENDRVELHFSPNFKQPFCKHKRTFFAEVFGTNKVTMTFESDGTYTCRGFVGMFLTIIPQGLPCPGMSMQHHVGRRKRSLNFTRTEAVTMPINCSSYQTRNTTSPLQRFRNEWLRSGFFRNHYRRLAVNQSEEQSPLCRSDCPVHLRCDPERQELWLRQALDTSPEIQRLFRILERFEYTDSCTLDRQLCQRNDSCFGCNTTFTTCPPERTPPAFIQCPLPPTSNIFDYIVSSQSVLASRAQQFSAGESREQTRMRRETAQDFPPQTLPPRCDCREEYD